MPSFRLEEITTSSPFGNVIPAFWRSYANPRDSAMEFVYPVKGTSKEAYEAAVEDSKRRTIASHKEDPSSHWIQVLDSENDDAIIGAAEWHIYDSNAEDSYPPTDIDWWPEGDTKKFTIMMFDTNLAISRKRQRRSHIGLSICFTDPKYRNQGAGTMMVDWGVRKADELGLECFITATLDMSMPLYKKARFLVVVKTVLEMKVPDSSDEWKACQKQLLPYWWYNMWRPVGGNHEEGAKYSLGEVNFEIDS